LNQRIFAELIPDSHFVLIPEGSHCPQMEKPGLVNEAIEQFLRSLAGPRPVVLPGKKSKPKTEARGRSGAKTKVAGKPKRKRKPSLHLGEKDLP
jgi:hypothetical protein